MSRGLGMCIRDRYRVMKGFFKCILRIMNYQYNKTIIK